jgi:hypothetical protein
VKELLAAYLESSRGFAAMLEERTPSEVEYDNEVIQGLGKGFPIKKALKHAGEKYPEQALQWDEDTIADLKAHYEYLKTHEEIMARLRGLQA